MNREYLQIIEDSVSRILGVVQKMLEDAENKEDSLQTPIIETNATVGLEETMDQDVLRELLIHKTRQGKGEAVRQLLSDYNVIRLSQLKKEDYYSFYEMAKQI